MAHRNYKDISIVNVPWTDIKQGELVLDPHIGKVKSVSVSSILKLGDRPYRILNAVIATLHQGEVTMTMEIPPDYTTQVVRPLRSVRTHSRVS